jgi:hypothetical protein
VANLFTSQTPSLGNVSEGAPVTVATTVWFSGDGTVTGGRFYGPSTVGSGSFVLAMWQITADDSPAGTGTGTLLGTATFGTLTAGAWNSVSFSSPISVTANTAYRIGVRSSEGRYAATGGFFNSGSISNGGITASSTGANPTGIGVLDNGSYIENTTSYPNKTFNGNLYFVDVAYTAAPTAPAPATVAAITAIGSVVAGGPPPAIVMGPDRPVVVGSSVQLDASVTPISTDTITGYSWSITAGSGSLTNATTTTPTYTPPGSGAGTATVRLQATGSSGGVATATMKVAYGSNVVAAENQLTGTPRASWDLVSPNLGGIASLQGFCDGFSVNKSSTVNFKIAQSDGVGWTAQVYRLGYYNSDGARLYASLTPSGAQLTASQSQPAPLDVDSTTTKISTDCSNWSTTLTWTPPVWAPSGIYILRLSSSSGTSHVMFVLRDDSRAADLMLMPADSTWNAYNAFGGMGTDMYAGNSLYWGTPVLQDNADCGRFVSYNRPVVNRGAADSGRSYGAVGWSNFFTSEYPAVRFVERNGIDVKYYACLDAAGDATGSFLLGENGRGAVKAAMTVGHAEYWSDIMRAGWERAKNRGINMFFCSSNEVFWRLIGSDFDSQSRPRTWECYKTTIDGDGSARSEWTGTWRDPTGAGKGGSNPENTLTGTSFVVNGPDLRALVVPFTGGYSAQPLWRNTTVASLSSGTWTSPGQILGFEWDTYGPAGVDTGAATYIAAPHPRVRYCSDVTYSVASQVLTNAGSTYSSGNATHRLVVHPGGAGAMVFGTGTMNWAFGLDPANFWQIGSDNASAIIQQATLNMLTDMGAAPTTLMGGMTQPSPVDWYPDIVTGTVTATVTIPGPSLPVVVSPNTVVGTTAIGSAAAQAGSKVLPATLAAVTAIGSAAAQAGARPAPAVLAASTTIPGPAAQAGAGVVAATVAGTVTVPAPAFVSTATATPAVLPAAATIPGPAAQGGAVLMPDTVAAVAALADPAIQLGLKLLPATVTGSASFAAVVFQSGALPAPVTVLAVAQVRGDAIPEGSQPEPSTLAGGAGIPGPAVRAGAGVTAATLSAATAVAAPSVFTGTEASITASTVFAGTTVGVPALAFGRTVAPAALVAVVAIPVALAKGSLSADIPAGTLTVTVLFGEAIPNSIVPRIVAWRHYITDTTGRNT